MEKEQIIAMHDVFYEHYEELVEAFQKLQNLEHQFQTLRTMKKFEEAEEIMAEVVMLNLSRRIGARAHKEYHEQGYKNPIYAIIHTGMFEQMEYKNALTECAE